MMVAYTKQSFEKDPGNRKPFSNFPVTTNCCYKSFPSLALVTRVLYWAKFMQISGCGSFQPSVLTCPLLLFH
ncbi:hypothetical protein SLEP1_g19947 [Rubroshorea leprosula]|uniref:Uncharacterized protein n=1 Tax=Rubroshorea leprosula TaxID=152421 RepID=A0AAV5J4D6_9ROSI|nr:hypothetical protein SLEP1_g19947 [Rubroshorea leprosula]